MIATSSPGSTLSVVSVEDLLAASTRTARRSASSRSAPRSSRASSVGAVEQEPVGPDADLGAGDEVRPRGRASRRRACRCASRGRAGITRRRRGRLRVQPRHVRVVEHEVVRRVAADPQPVAVERHARHRQRPPLAAPESRLLAGEEAQDWPPTTIVSPVSSGRLSPRRRSPLRSVPFAEPRSVTCQPPPADSMRAWCRETFGDTSRRSFPSSRPTVSPVAPTCTRSPSWRIVAESPVQSPLRAKRAVRSPRRAYPLPVTAASA